MHAARLFLRSSLLQIPLGDGTGIADAKKPGLADQFGAILQSLIRLVHPDQTVDAPILAAVKNDFLVPSPLQRIPYLDIAIRATNG